MVPGQAAASVCEEEGKGGGEGRGRRGGKRRGEARQGEGRGRRGGKRRGEARRGEGRGGEERGGEGGKGVHVVTES